MKKTFKVIMLVLLWAILIMIMPPILKGALTMLVMAFGDSSISSEAVKNLAAIGQILGFIIPCYLMYLLGRPKKPKLPNPPTP